MKECLTCGEVKPFTDMVQHRGRADGCTSRCKVCAAAKEKVRWAINGRGPDEPRQLMLNAARKRARAGGYPCTIVLNDIIIPELCPVLGIPLFRSGDRDNVPSLDKIVPALGYVPGNIVVISLRANRIKSDATLDELRLIANFFNS